MSAFLVDIGRLAAERADPNRFLNRAVVQIARAVEIHHVKILNTGQIRPISFSWRGDGKKALWGLRHCPPIRSPPGQTFQTAEPVSIKNLSEQTEYVHSDILKEHGILSLSNVPVLIDGCRQGVLEVDSTTVRDFTEDTTDFLTAAGAL